MINEPVPGSQPLTGPAESQPPAGPDFLLPAASLVVLLVAAFLRFYQLPALPPGLNFDEAGSGVAGLDILQGAPKIWWRLGGGQEPLWPYLAALATAILGNIPLALRLPAAAAGILSVAATYRLAATLPLPRRHTVALLASLGLALSGWHIHFSRLGFRAILLPLFSTLGFYFLWRAILAAPARRASSRLVVLAALFMALATYSYLAARLLPLVFVLFFGLEWLGRLPNRRAAPGPGLALTGRLFLYWLVFLLPLLLYFSLHPADLLARSTTVSIFNPAWNQGDVAGAAWRTLVVTLGTFAGLAGDTNPLANLPGQPALPSVLALFFGLGLAASLYRAGSLLRRSRAASAGAASLFLLCWWGVMLLPAVLAPEGAPHHLRLLGAIVPTYVLAAVGVALVIDRVGRWAGWAPVVASFLAAALYLFLGWQSYTNYFARWPAAVDFTLPFDLYAVRLAGDIAGAQPGVVYVLPMDVRAGEEARHYTIDYLLASRPGPSYVYVPVDEARAEELLRKAAGQATELRVVRWTGDKQQEADAREIITFLLATSARLVERESFPVYDVEIYHLPEATETGGAALSLPVPNRPVKASFENRLLLEAVYTPATAAPGSWLPVSLALTPIPPVEVDYKASLRLVSPAGERVAQKDRVLLHTYHQGSSLWPPGETVNEYYLLPVPPEAPRGSYTVTLVLYHPDTLAPLIAGGLAEVPLGTVAIK